MDMEEAMSENMFDVSKCEHAVIDREGKENPKINIGFIDDTKGELVFRMLSLSAHEANLEENKDAMNDLNGWLGRMKIYGWGMADDQHYMEQAGIQPRVIQEIIDLQELGFTLGEGKLALHTKVGKMTMMECYGKIQLQKGESREDFCQQFDHPGNVRDMYDKYERALLYSCCDILAIEMVRTKGQVSK